ncbi:hypothetical protein HZS_3443 [Henneguya salminicola]|nr:hypothetical protein HZS_3443 [Henneguya salminicola]
MSYFETSTDQLYNEPTSIVDQLHSNKVSLSLSIKLVSKCSSSPHLSLKREYFSSKLIFRIILTSRQCQYLAQI